MLVGIGCFLDDDNDDDNGDNENTIHYVDYEAYLLIIAPRA